MLGLSASQIRGYTARGFLSPERGSRGELRFGFQDLVILRTAAELTAAKVPQRKIRREADGGRKDSGGWERRHEPGQRGRDT